MIKCYDVFRLYCDTLQKAILTQCSPAETHAFIFLSSVRAVAFSPGGTEIASGGDDGYIRLWHGLAWETLLLELQGHTKRYELNPKNTIYLFQVQHGKHQKSHLR
jgi:WD40 repeat protein